MAKSNQGTRGERGMRGVRGKTGTTGAQGKVGRHGPAGTLAGSEHEEILIVRRRIEDIYEGLNHQIQRTAKIQLDLDALRAKLQAFTRASK